MKPKINYVAGDVKFLEAIYSGEKMTPIIITKVAKKYAYAVNQQFHGTDDEKDMTFKIDLTTDTAHHCAHPKRVYDSVEQFENIQAATNARFDKIAQLKKFKFDQLNDADLDAICAIAKIEV